MKVKILLSGIFILSLFVSLFIGTLFSYHLQKDEQEDFAANVLENAETVTGQLVSVLSTTNQLSDFTCTEDHIDKLREVVQVNSEIFDVGYIAEGIVLCTANWGVITPVKLKAQDVGSQNGYHFYSNEQNLYRISDHYNITVKNNFFAVNITTPYSRMIKSMPEYQFKIYSSKGHVFDEFTPQQIKNGPLSLRLKTNICSDDYDYCVMTSNSNAGLAYYSAHTIQIIFLTSIVFSYLITHLSKMLIANNQSIESRFRKALIKKSLFMEYQPIVSIQDGKIIAVESLVRWKDDVFGNVPPDLFIGIAEKLSLYPQLAHFTATRTICDIAPILREDPQFSVAINIGSYEILEHGFLMFLEKVAQNERVIPSQIKIEITESIDVALADLADFSSRARKLGFMVVLDDFGTGVSNLVWLTEVDFDYIKIDRVFVNSLNFDVKKGMASAVMELVASLGKEVVFEGVETDHEYRMIKEHCTAGYVQGWLFYRSLPLAELKSLLKSK